MPTAAALLVDTENHVASAVSRTKFPALSAPADQAHGLQFGIDIEWP